MLMKNYFKTLYVRNSFGNLSGEHIKNDGTRMLEYDGTRMLE